ncbi:unnamed protein product [Phytophthora lilii]|uniref:Unnamed protein product n=1 Tax=Phytophthora lilii TaxID=2077276 RepID=A0A9W7D9M1_9STRA|nr:unnamed protein product [Phytophthora lilii]
MPGYHFAICVEGLKRESPASTAAMPPSWRAMLEAVALVATSDELAAAQSEGAPVSPSGLPLHAKAPDMTFMDTALFFRLFTRSYADSGSKRSLRRQDRPRTPLLSTKEANSPQLTQRKEERARAHVLVRLRGDATTGAAGICRTSASTVRLEHSEMSPGVASITFEQVFDTQDSTAQVFRALAPAVDAAIAGKAATVVATGAPNSGKSFSCHGDLQKPSNGTAEPGIVTLAIRHVFSHVERKSSDGWKCNVLLSCWGVECSENREIGALADLLTPRKSIEVSSLSEVEKVLVDHSMVATTPVEAVQLYSRALERLNGTQNQDFVFALHVETQSPNGEAKRGRMLVVDIHGGSIIEPRRSTLENQTGKKDCGQYFLDTQFPVNEPLSSAFGAFVGGTSVTYLLVGIQTPAQFQQQAIQSLLYACKAKEIKSSSKVNYLSALVEKHNAHQLVDNYRSLPSETGNQTPGCREDFKAPEAPDISTSTPFFSSNALPTASPPLSPTASDSTCELSFRAQSCQVSDEAVLSPSISTSTSCESDERQKQSVVSRRVRKAYDLAKAATSSPAKTTSLFVTPSNQLDEAEVHDTVDRLLTHLPHDTLQRLNLSEKLEQIRVTQLELERALTHETSIKDKCVDRISRLSQTMSCQVVEHEHQLQEALTAKHAAEAQLRDLITKFDDVGREVTRLQEEVKVLKSGKNGMDGCEGEKGESPSSESDRMMLHTLSARLEEAMVQAKDVITFKDSVIQSLEERLQLASKRGADIATLLEEERRKFEHEKAELIIQLQQTKQAINNKTSDDISRVRAENIALQQQKAELTVRVAQLTLELETSRAQWAHDASERENRAEQRCAEQIAQTEQKLEQATASMQQQMAQFRAELDMKVAQQRVAARVTCKAGELKCDKLERDLQRAKLKLAKQKVKLEKKARVLVANAHKQHEQPVAVLQSELKELSARLDIVTKQEQRALARAKMNEETADRLHVELEQLKLTVIDIERERAALGNLCKELETDKAAFKTEFERRAHYMDQSLAKQIMATEARVHEERDRQIEKLIEQHNIELRHLKVAQASAVVKDRGALLSRQQSSSSESSQALSSEDDASLSSDGNHQQSIDELDALIDSKERRYRHLEKRRKAASSTRSSSSSPPTKSSSTLLKRELASKREEVAELSARQKQLLAALATANEQETLAKKQIQEVEAERQNELARYEDLLQQLNNMKQENWNLSLALHVTETNNQQQQRRPSRAKPM